MSADVSIIIPTFNRCEILRETLESIHALSFKGIFSHRFLIIDNNSTDRTKDVVDEFKKKYKEPIEYFFEPQQGISNARNRGVKEAKSEFVVFTDDDCRPNFKWLQEIFQCFQETNCDAIGGRILPSFPPNSPKWTETCRDLLRGPIVFHDYGEENVPYREHMIEFVGANIAFRRNVFEKFGHFRADLGVGMGTMGEETEFFQRLKQNGCKIIYCGKAVVWHPVVPERLTLKYLAKWNIGLGKYRYLVDEKAQLDSNLRYIRGIPRYLVREMIGHAVRLPLAVFDRRKLLQEWKELTIKVGRASAMRQIYFKEKKK